MSDENRNLIPQQTGDIAERESADIDSLTRTGDYLPQLRVYGSEATIVKKQEFPMGHFGLYFAQNKVLDLGEQTDCLVIDWRPKASIVSGDTPINFYGRFDPEEVKGKKWKYSDEFIEVKDKAMSKVKGYLVGLEYLFWFPSIDKFALFHMGNPTLRRESSNVKALVGCAATLKIKLIEQQKYTWHGCTVFPCTTPFDIPEIDNIEEQRTAFRDPKDSNVEFVKEEATPERAR